MKQLSKLAGVSQATVSNVLNHKNSVKDETALKVMKIAYEMGYFEEDKIRKVKFVTKTSHTQNGIRTLKIQYFS
jgi:LacI family transcriptional regulator